MGRYECIWFVKFESEGSVISREIKISGREMDGIGGVGHLGV